MSSNVILPKKAHNNGDNKNNKKNTNKTKQKNPQPNTKINTKQNLNMLHMIFILIHTTLPSLIYLRSAFHTANCLRQLDKLNNILSACEASTELGITYRLRYAGVLHMAKQSAELHPLLACGKVRPIKTHDGHAAIHPGNLCR